MKTKSSRLISDSPTMKAPAQSSEPTHIPCGTGSRPVPSRYKIEGSAPSDPHTMGRGTPGALK